MKFSLRHSGWRSARDLATWGVGVTLALVSFFRTGRIDYSLYPVIGGCLGLPFIFRAEDRPKGGPVE